MSLFSALSASASGMSAQRVRAELLVENLANAETTRTEEGGPYRRKDAIFAEAGTRSPFGSIFQAELGGGVTVEEIVEDARDPEKRYIPGHPDADAEGYVAFPRLSPAEEMVDLMAAARGYHANISAMTAVKDMLQRSIDLVRL